MDTKRHRDIKVEIEVEIEIKIEIDTCKEMGR